MIRYALRCDRGDAFEAWFRNSADFDEQQGEGALECPVCGSSAVSKDVMAPAVKRAREADPRAVAMAMAQKIKRHIRENHEYVGERFAEEARAIHEGCAEDRPIWGEATPDEARALVEDGLPVAALPPDLAPDPPRKLN